MPEGVASHVLRGHDCGISLLDARLCEGCLCLQMAQNYVCQAKTEQAVHPCIGACADCKTDVSQLPTKGTLVLVVTSAALFTLGFTLGLTGSRMDEQQSEVLLRIRQRLGFSEVRRRVTHSTAFRVTVRVRSQGKALTQESMSGRRRPLSELRILAPSTVHSVHQMLLPRPMVCDV